MKNTKLILAVATLFGAVSVVSIAHADVETRAETRKASSTAIWQATAIKDTKSMLVVTPLKSLTFNYAAGQKSFNQQNGAFDVAIQGQEGATDFQLTAKVITDKLTRTTDNSELTVGVKWNGTSLLTAEETTLIDFNKGTTAGLDNLGQETAFGSKDRVTDRGAFNFVIASAKLDDAVTSFEELSDGTWDGDVSVQFTAVWTLP
ncbi:common pilus major fimbrillin subunit EcpA [Moellerella wisconsensis]|uniref:common pilus major fimbrillin subunit EcpA n=1 Tax=Moellerella wisconsensis TaxID=158849 RepID=UPI001F4DC78A|nr:common pilus major fimbrillin subunit EcpA [Moellerella wisconsensis]UNH43809.1 common pilus major fimbrillin subunit EcpA [Moellerella wisconsensis]WJW83150.1 common pilus major fimbrillin subunit EcpA [Moellerella wisconsensis]